jgi:predicted PurR-regulated permease PerM
MLEPSHIGIAVAVMGFLMALVVHIVLVAKAWGSFKTIIEKLEDGAEKLEGLIERLFQRTEEHGNRLTSLETEREFSRRTTDKVHR